MMFVKPVRIKSQSQMKGSDRKKIRNQLAGVYPQMSDCDLQQLIPNKEEMVVTRLMTHQGENVVCYSVQKQPLFFEVEGQFFPTVYTLWKYPDLLPTFTTFPDVLQKLSRGAALMLPGIVLEGEVNLRSYGSLERDAVVAVNLTSNRAPAVVGRTALSSYDMYMAARQGKAVNVVHCVGDYLWAMGDKSSQPKLGPVTFEYREKGTDNGEERVARSETETIDESDGSNGDCEEIKSIEHKISDIDLNDSDTSEKGTRELEHQVEDVDEDPVKNMDDLLQHCFLKALRTSAKKAALPMLTSNFYRLHMVAACPKDKVLDIKKSSYKKLSKFLEVQQKGGIVTLKELSKGVQSIMSIQFSHTDVTRFTWDKEEDVKPVDPAEDLTPQGVQQIEELYNVTAAVAPLFKHANYNKGSVLSAAEVRRVISEYVKSAELQNTIDKRLVNLDPVVGCLLQKSECDVVTLTWEEMMQRCLSRMTPAHRVKLSVGQAGVAQVKKGKLEPIDISVVTRSGNKKVTLIYNVNLYGIDPHEFAHKCQLGVAASTTVGAAANRKDGCVQVMVQGNQVVFVSKLLLDDYKIPRKYIRGLENAPKKKKK